MYVSQSHSPDFMIRGGEEYQFVKDHLGSVKLVVKVSDGSVVQNISYDEFGKVLSDSNPGFQPFGFAGGVYDHQASLTKFGVRDYDPEVGRWLTKDPILFNGGAVNLYGYVENDSINKRDYSGLYSVCSRPLTGFDDTYGPLRHDYLCANGKCGGQGPSGNKFRSPGIDTNDPAPGSDGVTCDENGEENLCMDKCIERAIDGGRPEYRLFGSNCQDWVNDVLNKCSSQCGK